MLLAGCSVTGSGVREEGPARVAASTVAPTPAPSSPTPEKVDPVRLIKNDPSVDPSIRRALRPCAADDYPIDVSYGSLTGNSGPDVVINVLTCEDSFGVGSYVYRAENRPTRGAQTTGPMYRKIFADETGPVYAEISGEELEVTKQIYAEGDRVCCPSGEEVVTYRWRSGDFVERGRIHNDYSKSAGGGVAQDSPAPRPAE
ncbi:hypothetical protein HCK00_24845 [Streptomyces sp. PLAI1-29]|uniref:Lipoprotein CseA n=1 Tax=Streptomyces zingiberis TaxID=2053010 RepID=A0ABX1C2J2_9ACTN|nr:hypothetical protein [Streptomyces zingiberis]